MNSRITKFIFIVVKTRNNFHKKILIFKLIHKKNFFLKITRFLFIMFYFQ